MMKGRKLRMGMIGGGKGSFIGAVHRMAANLDGQIELVCGAFSSDPQRSWETGVDLYLDTERVYGSWKEMLEKEAALPDDERMDLVSIVTPNHLHAEPALMAMELGFAVIMDKPLCYDMEEAKALESKIGSTGLPFALTHTYTGYPMVKEARQQVKTGAVGTIRKITVEYPQGWLYQKIEDEGQKQASWRTDPSRSGKSGAFGDIGTHAANMAEFVSGMKITRLLSRMSKVVDGRALDDDAMALLEFEGGIPGLLQVSQIAAGEENAIKVRVYGDKGGLMWTQRDPNSLLLMWPDRPDQILRTGNDYLSEAAKANTRIPAGHPEGYLEAFANIYRNFAMHLRAHGAGEPFDREVFDYPGIEDGIRGMMLIDAMVRSTEEGNGWVEV